MMPLSPMHAFERRIWKVLWFLLLASVVGNILMYVALKEKDLQIQELKNAKEKMKFELDSALWLADDQRKAVALCYGKKRTYLRDNLLSLNSEPVR